MSPVFRRASLVPSCFPVLCVGLVAIVGGCGGGSGEDTGARGGSDSEEVASTDSSRNTGAAEALTQAQRSRLGPMLRRLLAADTSEMSPDSLRGLSPAGQRDGQKVYAVLIEGAGTEVLRKANIPYVSKVGGTVTARLTAEQIRKAASIGEVQRIRAAREDHAH